jgi:penicillin-binding protein-related factor A (putative recombinase)
MATIKRIISGHKSKSNGDKFEAALMHSAWLKGWAVIKIPSGCKQAGKQLIRVRTPFDFVFAKNGHVIMADAKTTLAKSFGYASITQHQLQELLKFEKQGVTAGYIINWATADQVRFYSASQLSLLKPNQGVNTSSGTLIGTSRIADLDEIVKVTLEVLSTTRSAEG